MRNDKFTLCELVAVIFMVMVMAALTAPVIGRAGSDARKTDCAANLKQSLLAMMLYAADCQGVVCTYGDKYSGWYQQPTMPENLGIILPAGNPPPDTFREVTLCPQAYGVAWINLEPDDYKFDRFETVKSIGDSQSKPLCPAGRHRVYGQGKSAESGQRRAVHPVLPPQ